MTYQMKSPLKEMTKPTIAVNIILTPSGHYISGATNWAPVIFTPANPAQFNHELETLYKGNPHAKFSIEFQSADDTWCLEGCWTNPAMWRNHEVRVDNAYIKEIIN